MEIKGKTIIVTGRLPASAGVCAGGLQKKARRPSSADINEAGAKAVAAEVGERLLSATCAKKRMSSVW